MKTKIHFCSLSLLVLLLSTGCDWHRIRGNGQITTDQRPVTALRQVEAEGYFDLTWHPGAPSCSVTTDENLVSHIRTRMSGDKLTIDMTEGAIAPTRGIKIVISSPSLQAISLSGAVEFHADQLSGAKFAMETSGATKVTLSGRVDRFLADMSGASKLQAADLSTNDTELSVTGAGKAEVTVTNSLRAAITGAGKVIYGGNPKSVTRQITGAGKIEPRD